MYGTQDYVAVYRHINAANGKEEELEIPVAMWSGAPSPAAMVAVPGSAKLAAADSIEAKSHYGQFVGLEITEPGDMIADAMEKMVPILKSAIAGFDEPSDSIGPRILTVNPLIVAANIAHAVNDAYRQHIGEPPSTEDITDLDRLTDLMSALAKAHASIARGRPMNGEESHQVWMDAKIADGWTYGPVKDVEKKTHPCLVPYEQLPKEQRFKDVLFMAVAMGSFDAVRVSAPRADA